MADPRALPIIAQVESGDRNIPAGPGVTTDSGQPQGNYQITTGTWKDFAPKAGVDLSLYPIPLSAPKELQGKVASIIPLARWAPKTVEAVNAMGLGGDASTAGAALGTNNYGFINPLIGKMEENQAESEKATAPFREQMQKQLGEDMARVHKAADAVQPVDIEKWTLPPPKNDPVDGFASIGAVFAGIASAFTHTPAINAMNGMAAAIEARKEGNETAYKQAYQAWKDNTQIAIDRQKIQSAAFTRALDLMQTDVAAGHAELMSAASVYGDRASLFETEAALYGKVAERNALADQQMMQWRIQMMRFDARPGTPEYITTQLFNKVKQDKPELSDPEAWAEAERQQQEIKTKPTAAGTKEAQIKTLADQQFRQAHDGRDPDPNNRDDQAELAKISTQVRQNTSVMSGRNAIMVQRGLTSAADAVTDIKNVIDLPITIDTGPFGGRRQGPGLIDAGREILANEVTPEDAQAYNAALAGLERSLGGLSTGGLAVSDEVMKQFAKLEIMKGDTNYTKLRKIASMRQNVDNAIDGILTNPQLSDKQREMAMKLQHEVAEAVPWSVHDVGQIQFGKDPRATVGGFAKRALGGGGDAPVFTEDQYNNAPSGTHYRAEQGGAVMVKP